MFSMYLELIGGLRGVYTQSFKSLGHSFKFYVFESGLTYTDN